MCETSVDLKIILIIVLIQNLSSKFFKNIFCFNFQNIQLVLYCLWYSGCLWLVWHFPRFYITERNSSIVPGWFHWCRRLLTLRCPDTDLRFSMINWHLESKKKTMWRADFKCNKPSFVPRSMKHFNFLVDNCKFKFLSVHTPEKSLFCPLYILWK